jgi:hypothetical protein
VVFILIYAVAYLIRPWVTDLVNRKYFIPALSLKLFCAIALGLLYQFYYKGGDTFNYHTHGSRHVWEALMDDPARGIKLFINNGEDYVGVYEYASEIYFLRDPQSYSVIRLAAFLDVFTFSSYAGTALLFAFLSFAGVWALFLTFYDIAPHVHKRVAAATLFIPSVLFWGSGLLKDTITLACLGIATYSVYILFIKRKFRPRILLPLTLSLAILYSIKIYILLVFLPSAVVWIFISNYRLLKSWWLRITLFPFVVIGTVLMAYVVTIKAGEDNAKYSIDTIAKTAQVTAYDIRYWSGRNAGSGYTLGELDGTWNSMIKLAPAAINVSLFRPYIWEANNAFMLLASLESLFMLLFTAWVIKVGRVKFFRSFQDPTILFCLVFSLIFAFAVGVSTYNFGTLMRYKIPLMPFYCVGLVLILDYVNKLRKADRFETTE